MTKKPKHFTIHELESLSGFDRRTIAYYIQEGLLPKIGRRGPGTVYPAAFKERLMFIRAVRDLQDAGTLRAVTLAEIRKLMLATSTDEIRRWQKEPDTKLVIRSLFLEPDWNVRALAVPAEEVANDGRSKSELKSTSTGAKVKTHVTRPPEAAALSTDFTVRQLLHSLEQICSQRARKSKGGSKNKSASPVPQCSVHLSPNISITATHLEAEHWHLLTSLADLLSADT